MKLLSRLLASAGAFALATHPAFAVPQGTGPLPTPAQIGAQTPTGPADANTVGGSPLSKLAVGVTPQSIVSSAGTGGDDLNAITQAEVIAAAGAGNNTVYLPAGTYKVNLTNGSLRALSNLTLQGSGAGKTVLICDDTQGGAPGSCIQNLTGGQISNFWVRGITFQGMNQINPNNGKGFSYIVNCLSCGIEDSEGLYSRGMSFRFQSSDKIRLARNRILKSNSDCLAVWDTPNALITQNWISGCADDAISTHSQDSAAAPVRSGVIVTENVIEESQGIKALGAKVYRASNNALRRIMGVGIYVDAQASFAQGDTPNMAVALDDNSITDVFQRQDGSGNQAQAYIIVSGGPKQAVIPAFGAADTSGLLYANGTNNASNSPGGSWLSISRNTLVRTLPAVTAYANWGHSSGLWDGQTGAASGGVYTGAIPEAALNTRAIQVNGPMRAAHIDENIIATTSTCLYFASGSPSNIDYDGVFFRHNTCMDHGNNGVSQAATAMTNQRIFIEGNAFDGDPRFVHANRGSSGTWQADSYPYGVSLPFFNGVRLARNSFRNEADPINQGSALWAVGEGNLQFGNPVGTNNGFSASNVGIGAFKFSGWDVLQQDENQNSATYGATLSAALLNRAFNQLTANSMILGASTNTSNQYSRVNGAASAERGVELQTAGIATWRLIVNNGGQLVFGRLNNNGTYGTYVDSPLVFGIDGSVNASNKWSYAGETNLKAAEDHAISTAATSASCTFDATKFGLKYKSASAGSCTLEACTTAAHGRTHILKWDKGSAGQPTLGITSGSGDLIDGASTFPVSAAGKAVTVMCNEPNTWDVTAQ